MPVTVKFDPNVTSPQSAIIPDATVNSDGVMTKAQVRSLTGAKGASILWTFGQQTWAQVYAQARAAVAAGSFATIYLDDDGSHTFEFSGDVDLTNIAIASARVSQQLANFAADFRVLNQRIQMEGISAFTNGTWWTDDGRLIDWRFVNCSIFPSPGSPNIGILGGNGNVLRLLEFSFVQGDNPPGHTVFGMKDGSGVQVVCQTGSNFDGTLTELAPGAVSATMVVFYDATCIDEVWVYPINPGINFVRQSTAGDLPPVWKDAVLVNGWEAFGAPGAAPSYYVDPNARVQLRGWAKSGASGTVAFQMSGSYVRPRSTLQFVVPTNGGNLGIVTIDTAANVTIADAAGAGANATVMVSLDSISFYGET
jgi:hypothetical protein